MVLWLGFVFILRDISCLGMAVRRHLGGRVKGEGEDSGFSFQARDAVRRWEE